MRRPLAVFFFSSRRRHTRSDRDWSSDVCSSDLLRIAGERRAYLLGRLGHKMRSAVLSLQESARQAAFGRPELLEQLYEQAQELGRRAAALEAAALDPKDTARGVVFGAVLNNACAGATLDVPAEAVVRAPEPVLLEAMAR